MLEIKPSDPAPLVSLDTPPAVAPVCPWLGLIDDPATRYDFASGAHTCHAKQRPREIAMGKQARDCLTTRHPACTHYRPVVPAAPTPLATLTAIEAEPRNGPARSRLEGVRSLLARLALFAALMAIAIAVGYLIGLRLALAS